MFKVILSVESDEFTNLDVCNHGPS